MTAATRADGRPARARAALLAALLLGAILLAGKALVWYVTLD